MLQYPLVIKKKSGYLNIGALLELEALLVQCWSDCLTVKTQTLVFPIGSSQIIFKFPKLKILETSIFFFFFFFFFFFSKVQKVKYLPHFFVIFSVSLPMVNLYKFCKREILIQPPGEPREQHLGDVRPKKFELHKISKKTK